MKIIVTRTFTYEDDDIERLKEDMRAEGYNADDDGEVEDYLYDLDSDSLEWGSTSYTTDVDFND
jgi:hypothetical protein